MSAELWDGSGPVLADTSAWIVARRVPEVREPFLAAIDRADVVWCWPVRYELMVDSRSIDGTEAIDRTLERLREVAVDRAVQRGVLSAMRRLAASGSHGAHRLALTDLTVAVAAQLSGLPVLHHDAHFDRLAALLGIDAPWIVRSSD